MNEAQNNLHELKLKIPLSETREREFIVKCIGAWEGYTDMEYSTPHWQLRKLEEVYGLTVSDINKKYV